MFRARFRSTFEAQLCFDLQQNGVDIDAHYERERLAYTVPARTAQYLPDLISRDGRLIIEIKGRFHNVEERQKYIHFRDSNPHIEVRFVLMKAKQKLYKGSSTLVEDWLRAKGFQVAIGAIPPEWIEDLTR